MKRKILITENIIKVLLAVPFFASFEQYLSALAVPPKMMLVTYCRTDLAVELSVVTSWLHQWFRAHAARWSPSTDSCKYHCWETLKNDWVRVWSIIIIQVTRGLLSLVLRRPRLRYIVLAAHLKFQCTVISKNQVPYPQRYWGYYLPFINQLVGVSGSKETCRQFPVHIPKALLEKGASAHTKIPDFCSDNQRT